MAPKIRHGGAWQDSTRQSSFWLGITQTCPPVCIRPDQSFGPDSTSTLLDHDRQKTTRSCRWRQAKIGQKQQVCPINRSLYRFLPVYSASAKVICFIGKLGEWNLGISPKSGSLLQDFLSGLPGRNTQYYSEYPMMLWLRHHPSTRTQAAVQSFRSR